MSDPVTIIDPDLQRRAFADDADNCAYYY